ncbi:MAG TPA: hypothetical protein VE007_14080 [Thermoanaerobaculia bacterium]|nr:hypothetical protein [Thermoanaerobaculia bacterium]
MNSVVPTEPGGLPARSSGWLRIVSLSLALAALAAPAAFAGVEFVTPIGNCTNKVDTIGDGKDLFLTAGSVQFEVFGNSVDLSNPTSGFRIATDSGTGTATAKIIQQRSGATNLGRGCGNTGSAVVQVDSDPGITSNIQRSLFFRMPLGDESRLQMTIRAIPTFAATWTSLQNNVSCIVKTGSFEKLDQDHKIRITLPPGSAQDQTTCNQNTLQVHIAPATGLGEIDVAAPVKFTATGLPNFMTANSPTAPTPASPTDIVFTLNVSGIRSLTAVSTSNIVVTSSNPHRTANLTFEVHPGIANGFTQAANCNNPLTGKSVKAGDLVQCELHLSLPPGNGQLITFQGVDRLCFAAGAPGVTYFASTGVGTTTLSGSGLIFQVPLRVQGGSMSTGQSCSSVTGVQQTVKFWVGQRDIESGADFTQDSIRIVNPQ